MAGSVAARSRSRPPRRHRPAARHTTRSFARGDGGARPDGRPERGTAVERRTFPSGSRATRGLRLVDGVQDNGAAYAHPVLNRVASASVSHRVAPAAASWAVANSSIADIRRAIGPSPPPAGHRTQRRQPRDQRHARRTSVAGQENCVADRKQSTANRGSTTDSHDTQRNAAAGPRVAP